MGGDGGKAHFIGTGVLSATFPVVGVPGTAMNVTSASAMEPLSLAPTSLVSVSPSAAACACSVVSPDVTQGLNKSVDAV